MADNQVSRPKTRSERGLTLVELLVVIAVIGILVGLLLPAVQAARETARQTQCVNHLKQVAIAFHLHLGAYSHFPTDGWGRRWVGDSDRGSGRNQPGGWTYNILPYIEQPTVHQLARDGLPDEITERQLAGAAQAVQTVLPWQICPTRRSAILYPLRNVDFSNSNHSDWSPRGDYVANWGDTQIDSLEGPGSLALGIRGVGFPSRIAPTFVTGIVFYRSTIRIAQVCDGTTQTYMVGEKSMAQDWLTALPGGSTLTAGALGSAAWIPLPDPQFSGLDDRFYRFGSSHPGGWHVAACDGSVRKMGFDVDAEIHRRLANRNDGLPTPAP